MVLRVIPMTYSLMTHEPTAFQLSRLLVIACFMRECSLLWWISSTLLRMCNLCGNLLRAAYTYPIFYTPPPPSSPHHQFVFSLLSNLTPSLLHFIVFWPLLIQTNMWKEGDRVYFESSIKETGKAIISGAYVDLVGQDSHYSATIRGSEVCYSNLFEFNVTKLICVDRAILSP